MIKSDSIASLTKAMAAAHKAYKPLKKESSNPFYNSKYADLAAVIEASDAALSDHGITVFQLPFWEGDRVAVTTIVSHESGEYLGETLVLPGAQTDPQKAGSAITYARRYSLQAILNIAADLDDDGNAASGKETAKVQSRPTKASAAGATSTTTVAQKPEPNGASPILTNEQRKTLLFDECYNIGGNNDVILAAIRKVTGQESSKLVRMNQVEAIKREVYYATGGERQIEKIDLLGGEIIP